MANEQWVLDLLHSEVNFSVKHMMISRVNGTFHKYDAKIEADPADLTTANIEFTVDLSSVDTKNVDRDGHLKSADFFDVENYPTLTFKSTNIVKTGENEYAVTGDLSIRGVTREETFNVVLEGVAKNPMSGAETVGFSVEGKIKRGDYGLVWNAALETGGVLVSDEVKISLALEASRA
ncbi:YceI family protein [Caldibacillus lycopersici]|uniref:YceI family protein n=1 Tax=Perspicuibacillus lycopersici TaxID=1325689 RepID=A0AAE3IXD9_9BACI|nr:YceI family protein [Perspicuibacillus lycopersici]MCU9614669.1 YceI family protein [Perspicuibacillus lycopersici]